MIKFKQISIIDNFNAVEDECLCEFHKRWSSTIIIEESI